MSRVLVVIGTRPEGIKLAPVIRALESRSAEVETRVALTGQHGGLMDQVLDVFEIPVHRDLGIMREGQDLYDVTSACLASLRDVVREDRPDMILVEGDTASVFAAGVVAFYERTRLGHVEAGLRSHDKWQPWPEEVLRRLTGVVADVHFAPTSGARKNLLDEAVPPDRVHVTGNTVVDALLAVAGQPHEPADPDLREALGSGRRLVLLTAHRRESFGEPLRRAFRALRQVADRFTDVELVYPVHPNPNVRAAAGELLGDHPRIRLTAPLDYRDLVLVLRESVLVVTDSGGIQEEAPTFGVPVLVMREVTERPEGVDAGIAALVGTNESLIAGVATAVLDGHGWRFLDALRAEREARAGEASTTVEVTASDDLAGAAARAGRMAHREYPNPYGDGSAGERIADIVVHELTGKSRRTEDWPGGS